jgi:hypothetical protein
MNHPSSGSLRTYASREEWRQAVAEFAPPTDDDCTVLVSGERIDSEAKSRAFLESVAEQLRELNS